jgi:surface protein
VLLNIYDNSRFVESQVSHVLFFLFCGCGLKRDLVVVVCVVGLVFFFFVAPFSLLAVFGQAAAFNQDVSKLNTSAVTSMQYSKCTLSPSLSGPGAFRCGVLLNMYGNSSFVGSHVSHVLFFLFVCGLKRDLIVVVVVCAVGLDSLFFVAPFSLAVFNQAKQFNQNVSTWNTGAVTNMYSSKCTLSLSVATAPSVVICC